MKRVEIDAQLIKLVRNKKKYIRRERKRESLKRKETVQNGTIEEGQLSALIRKEMQGNPHSTCLRSCIFPLRNVCVVTIKDI
jgi:hypothetical protein